MCNTVPNVIKKLGYEYNRGFTKKDLLSALLKDGYGPEKAERRTQAAILSHQVIHAPDDDTGKIYISIYCAYHWELYEDALKDVEILPVRIEADGHPVRL